MFQLSCNAKTRSAVTQAELESVVESEAPAQDCGSKKASLNAPINWRSMLTLDSDGDGRSDARGVLVASALAVGAAAIWSLVKKEPEPYNGPRPWGR